MAAGNARGPYLSQNRALRLERSIAATEARLMEKIAQLDRQLAELRHAQIEQMRTRLHGELELFRQLTGAPPGDHDDKET